MDALPPVMVRTLPRLDADEVVVSRLRFDVAPGETGGLSLTLADGRVATLVVQSAEDARSLAAAKRARGESSLYAADAKPPAGVVADALVVAGMGVS
jgi:hypothetical protein